MQVVPRGNAEELSQWFLGFSYLNRQRWPLPPLKSTGCLVVFNLIVKSLFSATRCLAWLLGGWVSGYQVLVLQGSGNPQKLQLVIEERGEDQKIPCAGFRKVLTNILQDFLPPFSEKKFFVVGYELSPLKVRYFLRFILSTWKVRDCTKTKIRGGIFPRNLSPFWSGEGQSTRRILV